MKILFYIFILFFNSLTFASSLSSLEDVFFHSEPVLVWMAQRSSKLGFLKDIEKIKSLSSAEVHNLARVHLNPKDYARLELEMDHLGDFLNQITKKNFYQNASTIRVDTQIEVYLRRSQIFQAKDLSSLLTSSHAKLLNAGIEEQERVFLKQWSQKIISKWIQRKKPIPNSNDLLLAEFEEKLNQSFLKSKFLSGEAKIEKLHSLKDTKYWAQNWFREMNQCLNRQQTLPAAKQKGESWALWSEIATAPLYVFAGYIISKGLLTQQRVIDGSPLEERAGWDIVGKTKDTIRLGVSQIDWSEVSPDLITEPFFRAVYTKLIQPWGGPWYARALLHESARMAHKGGDWALYHFQPFTHLKDKIGLLDQEEAQKLHENPYGDEKTGSARMDFHWRWVLGSSLEAISKYQFFAGLTCLAGEASGGKYFSAVAHSANSIRFIWGSAFNVIYFVMRDDFIQSELKNK